ncbi:hypothetical protein AMTR_s00050p00038900 [Amborella trichopoda]|uniref:Uncharacterized protein n=1 Tax=Amborella trichopoda TaxID=13333 RepID=W1PY54_AMBTC|nr:hypothetical protein AMTR_s00050p00038900 [Amborella trichopoda]
MSSSPLSAHVLSITHHTLLLHCFNFLRTTQQPPPSRCCPSQPLASCLNYLLNQPMLPHHQQLATAYLPFPAIRVSLPPISAINLCCRPPLSAPACSSAHWNFLFFLSKTTSQVKTSFVLSFIFHFVFIQPPSPKPNS